MRKILIITHGNLAQEFLEVAQNILEKQVEATAICCDLGSSHDEYNRKIDDSIQQLKPDEQLVILTDLFGGTPSNLTIPKIKAEQIEVITGLNLAMLIYLLSERDDKDFTELCRGTRKAGEEAIVIAGEFLT